MDGETQERHFSGGGGVTAALWPSPITSRRNHREFRVRNKKKGVEGMGQGGKISIAA